MNGLTGLVDRVVTLLPAAQSLVVAICFILGIVLAISAIRGFAASSEHVAAGQVTRSGLLVPTVMLIVAVLLMSLSATISAFLVSLFQRPETVAASEIFAYAPDMLKPLDNAQARSIVVGLLRVVQFIGLIGFIRGLFLLNKSVYAPRQGLAGFGTTHLIGGVLAMNIVQFTGMLDKLLIG